MVVGTDIEQIMVLPVVPADQGLVVAVTTFIGRNRSVQVEILLDLCQEPASRDHGMGFQQLFGSVGAHLRGRYSSTSTWLIVTIPLSVATRFNAPLKR